MITRLEEQLGARLFDRDTRNVALTPEGEIFSQGAHRIAAEMNATLSGLQERSQRTVGRVAMAAPPSLCAAWLPEQMAAFRQGNPGIVQRLHDVVSDRCLNMIAAGEVDFGLNAQRGNALEFEAHLRVLQSSPALRPSAGARHWPARVAARVAGQQADSSVSVRRIRLLTCSSARSANHGKCRSGRRSSPLVRRRGGSS